MLAVLPPKAEAANVYGVLLEVFVKNAEWVAAGAQQLIEGIVKTLVMRESDLERLGITQGIIDGIGQVLAQVLQAVPAGQAVVDRLVQDEESAVNDRPFIP
jgi:hypothetical protein